MEKLENTNYYTTDISEFVQGFKYEKCNYKKGDRLGSVGFLFGPRIDVMAERDEWIEQEVWWDRPLNKEYKTMDLENGDKILYKESVFDLQPTYDLGFLLNRQMIRAKV